MTNEWILMSVPATESEPTLWYAYSLRTFRSKAPSDKTSRLAAAALVRQLNGAK